MRHPTEAELAALRDGGLVEEEARALRAHVDDCAECSSVVRGLESLISELATPLRLATRADQLASTAMRPERARSGRAQLAGGVALVGALAAAALVVTMPESEYEARGVSVERAVHAQVYRVDEAGLQTRLADGDSAPRELSLEVRVSALPGPAERQFACVAVDASGRVTWLLPQYLATGAPSLLALGPSAGLFGGDLALTLPRLSPGPLEIFAMVLSERASAATLDQQLESGWRPTVGASGVDALERLVVFVGER